MIREWIAERRVVRERKRLNARIAKLQVREAELLEQNKILATVINGSASYSSYYVDKFLRVRTELAGVQHELKGLYK